VFVISKEVIGYIVPFTTLEQTPFNNCVIRTGFSHNIYLGFTLSYFFLLTSRSVVIEQTEDRLQSTGPKIFPFFITLQTKEN